MGNEPERDWAQQAADEIAARVRSGEYWDRGTLAAIIDRYSRPESAQGQPALDVAAVAKEIAAMMLADFVDGGLAPSLTVLEADIAQSVQAVLGRHFRTDESRAVLRDAFIQAAETRLFGEGPFYRLSNSGPPLYRPVMADQLRAMIDLAVDDALDLIPAPPVEGDK